MWNPFKKEKEYADPIPVTPDVIISDFAKAWEQADPKLIIKHLDESFVYDSQWVLESLNYHGYVDYIRAKMATIKKNNCMPTVRVVNDSHSACGKMLELNQGGEVCYYRIRISGGKVVKGDMCMF